jgi:hypothetical protein
MPPTKAPARRQDPEEEGEEELDEESEEDASEEDDYVELDLERTLTWTGNAVIVQAGGEFRMPLIVPHPSVLAIQFEVDNGADIEFSLMFKDDNEDEANLLVEPVRVTDREGQLDIDTTGMCEIIWSNNYAWMSSKTLSYQLQLAPKIDLLKKKWRQSIISAASDFRIMSAVSGAEKVDNLSKTIKQRKAQLQDVIATSREKTSLATTKYERYQGHVQRLEEEVKAAKVHAEAAASELQALHKEVSDAERTLIKLQNLRTLDQGVTAEVLRTLERVDEPLELLFDAYATSMYEQPQEEGEDPDQPPSSIDRAEVLHLLQDFEIIGRGDPPEVIYGVFQGYGQQLSIDEFKRALARLAVGVSDSKAPDDEPLAPLLLLLPERVEQIKLTSLDVPRRFKVLQACDMLDALLVPEDEYSDEEEEPEPAPAKA